MPSRILKATLSSLILILLLVSSSFAGEIKGRYATIIYDDEELLRKFNDKIFLGRGLYFLSKKRKNTVTEEIKDKTNVIVEKVEAVLEMFPEKLRFTIVLLPTAKDVQRVFKENYKKNVDYIAFYSPKQKTVYLSVKDIKLRVLAHEIGHVVVEHYFDVSPPVKIHELLAQFAETHITD